MNCNFLYQYLLSLTSMREKVEREEPINQKPRRVEYRGLALLCADVGCSPISLSLSPLLTFFGEGEEAAQRN